MPTTAVNHQQIWEAPCARLRLAISLRPIRHGAGEAARERFSVRREVVLPGHTLDAEAAVLLRRQLTLLRNSQR